METKNYICASFSSSLIVPDLYLGFISLLGRRQVASLEVLVLAFGGSNPSAPASFDSSRHEA